MVRRWTAPARSGLARCSRSWLLLLLLLLLVVICCAGNKKGIGLVRDVGRCWPRGRRGDKDSVESASMEIALPIRVGGKPWRYDEEKLAVVGLFGFSLLVLVPSCVGPGLAERAC